MVARTFIREQTMSNVNAEPKPSYYELNEEELEKATGGSQPPSKCHFSDLSVSKLANAASPGL